MALTLGQAARPGWNKGVWREKSYLFLVECVVSKGPQPREDLHELLAIENLLTLPHLRAVSPVNPSSCPPPSSSHLYSCPPASLCCWETATVCQYPSQMSSSLASQVASKLESLHPWGPKPPETPPRRTTLWFPDSSHTLPGL